jgi:hypothetical protein
MAAPPMKRANKKRRGQCQANQAKALHDWLMRLPTDVLEHHDLVVDAMSRHDGKRLTYQLLLQVRDEVRSRVCP